MFFIFKNRFIIFFYNKIIYNYFINIFNFNDI